VLLAQEWWRRGRGVGPGGGHCWRLVVVVVTPGGSGRALQGGVEEVALKGPPKNPEKGGFRDIGRIGRFYIS